MRERIRPNPLLRLAGTVLIMAVAYCVAVGTDSILWTLTENAKGGLPAMVQVSGLQEVLFGLLLLFTAAAFAVPYFQRTWDPPIRTFSLFAMTFTVAYAVLHASGVVDPDIPLHYFVRYVVDPLRLAAGHA